MIIILINTIGIDFRSIESCKFEYLTASKLFNPVCFDYFVEVKSIENSKSKDC